MKGACGALLLLGPISLDLSSESSPTSTGVKVSFRSLNEAAAPNPDTLVLPNFWLYVAEGQSPTPFLPNGRFVAEWNGQVSVPLRDYYRFKAFLNGTLEVTINDEIVVDTTRISEWTEASEEVRLNKGANAIRVRYERPPEGDGVMRLYWSSLDFAFEPLPSEKLSHTPTPELEASSILRRGRELFLEHRCIRCHKGSFTSASPELGMDAPSLDRIGARRRFEWLREWILDPKALRASAKMPQVFQGPEAERNAAAVAAFLSIQGDDPFAVTQPSPPSDSAVESGAQLVDTLQCAACHDLPGADPRNSSALSLERVHEKFSFSSLQDFLRRPAQHYEWIRMPDFGLSESEAMHIASYLYSIAGAYKPEARPKSDREIQTGKTLLQKSGCLNCHELDLENSFKSPALSNLTNESVQQGCLADQSGTSLAAPLFTFDQTDRQALRAFLASDRQSLSRHVPAEFAERHSRLLNCTECHGKFNGTPRFEDLGRKLNPAWTHRFLSGQVENKPRPWLPARMPAFGIYAQPLATGLAAGSGHPPMVEESTPPDAELAATGRTLISAVGGFSCISCHGVGTLKPTQVFEAEGINFIYSGERLLREYFDRWILNPLRIDSLSKMPVYFDEEGLSPLVEVYDGDGQKQLDAMWQYVRQGKDMIPPSVE